MKIKRKSINIFLLAFFLVGLFLTFGSQKAAAGYPCRDGGGSCYETSNCNLSAFGGKDLVSVSTAADAACAAVYEAPVKCCKTGTVSSSKPAAASNGSDSAATTPGGPTAFTNPLQFKTVEEFLGGILSAVQKIIVTLALVFIVIGAFLYITAGANPENAENGKKAIVAALIGLAIGIAAPSLLKELGNTIGWGDVNGSVVSGALGLSEIAVRVLNFLLGIMGILALIMLIIGAIMYLTSAGDEDRIDKGKEIFKYSLLGVIIAMASMVLVRQVASFFVTTPETPTAISAPGTIDPNGL